MANLDLDHKGLDMEAMRRRVRRSAHAQRAQAMLLAAGLSTLGLVAVAATLLTNLI